MRWPARLRALLHPFNIAGVLAWATVALSMQWLDAALWPAAATLLLAFLTAMFVEELLRPRHPRLADGLLWLEAACALLLIGLNPNLHTAQVLLVVWTAQLTACWSHRSTVLAVLLADIVVYLILRNGGAAAPLLVVSLYVGFQAFAALCAYYAVSAERARDRLAQVNADLLATRALLADSARDSERLRMARELHDVAGHKLTALTLNLRALAAEPALAQREEVRAAQQLAQELLGDIRGIVHAMRDARGLDLATALRALAAPWPRPRLLLEIADDVRVADPATAEAVLRLVQEALTNSARHADADVVRVRLHRAGERLALEVEDDGRLHGPLREGHGLAGMRERIAALGGSLEFGRSARGALRIAASLPL
ncbi:sensor histidine kinase [Vulcaniibacterium gelatinicum]|uniref:sensor histidine kinase n=1 Tax=Vulcaniibacterium gelatinicum TaxID=2598725 RepID=UPI0011C7FC13|nr:histidine kinase [Vulcaniibacterium gelatinicum]